MSQIQSNDGNNCSNSQNPCIEENDSKNSNTPQHLKPGSERTNDFANRNDTSMHGSRNTVEKDTSTKKRLTK